jgi:hypothetical protein
VYALFGLRILLSSIASLVVELRETLAMQGGGVFASSGDILFVPYALLALASIVANVMLRGWARNARAPGRTIYRAQRWTLLLAIAVVLTSAAGVNVAAGPWLIALIPLTAILWGAHFVVTAALLGTYALRTSSDNR